MTERTAQNFMKVAERFSNTKLISHFNSTQLITMLALPAGEEENFIAEKAAEGKPVETMSVKTLRASIKGWKAKVAGGDIRQMFTFPKFGGSARAGGVKISRG